MPAISVVIPAKDAAETLEVTLQSLGSQTFRDFEVVVVDDGSTDGTGDIAARHAGRLAMTVLRHEQPQGIARALNAGIDAAQAPLIARLDADDLAREDRLALQHAFLQQHPEVDLCGSHIAAFGHANGQLKVMLDEKPAHDAQIRTTFLHLNALAHPSLLIRRGFFERVGRYDPEWDTVEDLELWMRGALAGACYANISQPLTSYRVHARQTSRARAQLQFERDLLLKQRYVAALLGDQPAGHAAEWLSATCQFGSADDAWQVLGDSLPALTALASRVPDAPTYQQLLLDSLKRHLRRGG